MDSVNCQVSVFCQIDNFWLFFENVINAGDFTRFCQAGSNIDMLEFPAA